MESFSQQLYKVVKLRNSLAVSQMLDGDERSGTFFATFPFLIFPFLNFSFLNFSVLKLFKGQSAHNSLTVSQEMFDGDECLGTGSQSASVTLFFCSTRLKLIGFGVKHWKYGTHIGWLLFFQIRMNFISSPNQVFAYF